ncbi:pentatricopeptide repeat-containing protein At5g13770, chloroplastic [Vitis riparia]|uniref:pentatricopeptide repeat-containing protein At5g13770, chloroplastic n=1 Tax=Vitis riparia TaxID=96939 RepID=UPI00155A1016|nr:pentatricopeptide repeat-containing protein At5g13770, chloroplastic [Vitis riparia]
MAVSTSISTSNCRQPHKLKLTFTSTCKLLPIFSLPCSNSRYLFVNNSSYSSPIVAEESTHDHHLPVIELDVELPDLTPKDENLNDFLCGLFRDPRSEELAFDYYQKVKERPEFRPDKETLERIIRYLIRSKKWGLSLLVFEDFKSFDVQLDGDICCRLISSCIRARKFRITESLLEVFSYDDDVALLVFNSAMGGYNKLHMFSSTIAVYDQMKSAGVVPNSESYYRIMEAYIKIRDYEKVVTLFQEFESKKIDSSPFSTQICRILCESLGKMGRAFEALEFFRDMTKKGILEDSAVYSSLICSFASIREVKVAEELFREAEEKKILRDPEVFLKLVLMYVEEGLMERTLEIVKAMKNVKIRVSDCIFCAIVNGFAKKRGLRAAAKVYDELILQGCEPGQVTYASIINVYCRMELYSKAELVFSEMEKKGFNKCVVAYSSMVVMYGKTGRLREAMRLVAKMKERGCDPNVWVYNSLMDMHGRVKNLRQVEKLWKEMKRKKVVPDRVSYTSVISAYSKAGDFETCMRFYHEFRMNGGVIDRVIAGIMVGIFSKSGRVDELVKLLQDMKTEGTGLDERLYRSALNALRDAGLQMQARWLQESFDTT